MQLNSIVTDPVESFIILIKCSDGKVVAEKGSGSYSSIPKLYGAASAKGVKTRLERFYRHTSKYNGLQYTIEIVPVNIETITHI